jgi:hypothetical protein
MLITSDIIVRYGHRDTHALGRSILPRQRDSGSSIHPCGLFFGLESTIERFVQGYPNYRDEPTVQITSYKSEYKTDRR